MFDICKYFISPNNRSSMVKFVFLAAALWLSVIVSVQSNALAYIEDFKGIALQQMEVTGMPASIILAQGIVHSSVGEAMLAKNANNHFGIECDKNWQGESIYRYNDKNPMTCYKVFASPQQSFVEHCQNLYNHPKFKTFFYIDTKNYKKWARALAKLSYSETPNYSRQLVGVIEQYKLHELDKQFRLRQVANAGANNLNGEEIYYINGVKAIIANGEETPLALAARLNLSLKKLLKYNDLEIGDKFYPAQYVFLDDKKKTYKGDSATHTVREMDNIYLIAQQYGVQLKALLKRNRLKKSEEPAVGETVFLKEKAPKKPELRRSTAPAKPIAANAASSNDPKPPVEIVQPPVSVPPKNVSPPTKPESPTTTKPVVTNEPKPNRQMIYIYPDDPEYLRIEGTATPAPERSLPPSSELFPKPAPPVPSKAVPTKPVPETVVVPENVHLVKKGDTLYSISKKYGISVLTLKTMNNLTENTIEIDQQLKIK
jgi:LysM repeat protein